MLPHWMLKQYSPGHSAVAPMPTVGIRTASTATPDDPNRLYMKYDNDGNGTYDEYEYYDNLGNFPTEDQQSNDCVNGTATCPLAPTNPLDQFLTYLDTCSATATYTCQALENAGQWPPP